MIGLLERATELRIPVIVLAAALAQAIRNPARQARLSRLIRRAATHLVPLNGPDATAPDSRWPRPPRRISSTPTS
ncbi:MAG: hypothetical protein ABSB15_16505 [Bryobacteraceae bacterium]